MRKMIRSICGRFTGTAGAVSWHETRCRACALRYAGRTVAGQR